MSTFSAAAAHSNIPDNTINKVQIEKIAGNDDLPLPSYATEYSAGLDLYAAVDTEVIIPAGMVRMIPTGIKIALPDYLEGQVRPRSGLAAKFAVTVLNSPGTIDADYRGEIKVILINHGQQDFTVSRGMRIAQLVLSKYETITWQEVQALENDTLRGDKGFGSTGIS